MEVVKPFDGGGLGARALFVRDLRDVEGSDWKPIRKRKFDIFNNEEANEYFSMVYEVVVERKIAVARHSRRYADARTRGARESRETTNSGCAGWGGGAEDRRDGRKFGIPKGLSDAAEGDKLGGADDGDEGDGDDGDASMPDPTTVSATFPDDYDDVKNFLHMASKMNIKEAYSDLNNPTGDIGQILGADLESLQTSWAIEDFTGLIGLPYDAEIDRLVKATGGLHILPCLLRKISFSYWDDYPSDAQTYSQLEQWIMNTDRFHDDLCCNLLFIKRFHWWLLGQYYHLQKKTLSPLIFDITLERALNLDEISLEDLHEPPYKYLGLSDYLKIAVARLFRRYLDHARVDERRTGDATTRGARESRETTNSGCSGWGGGAEDRRAGREFGIPKGLSDAAEGDTLDDSDGGDGEDGEDGDASMLNPAAVSETFPDDYNNPNYYSQYMSDFAILVVYRDLENSTGNIGQILGSDLESLQTAYGLETMAIMIRQPYDGEIDRLVKTTGGMHILPCLLSEVSDHYSDDYPLDTQTYSQLEQWIMDTHRDDHDLCYYLLFLKKFHWWLLGQYYHLQRGSLNHLLWDKDVGRARFRDELSLDDFPPSDYYLGLFDLPNPPGETADNGTDVTNFHGASATSPSNGEYAEAGVNPSGDCCGDEVEMSDNETEYEDALSELGSDSNDACPAVAEGQDVDEPEDESAVVQHEPNFNFDAMEGLDFSEVEQHVWG